MVKVGHKFEIAEKKVDWPKSVSVKPEFLNRTNRNEHSGLEGGS